MQFFGRVIVSAAIWAVTSVAALAQQPPSAQAAAQKLMAVPGSKYPGRMRVRGARIVVREPHEPERDVAFVASKTGAQVVTLAASVGALPRADDYISLFDVNVEALTSAAAKR